MPSDISQSGSPRVKPSTRSSLRQSLNLASVGKAFADVINKEGKDSDKSTKKAKDLSSRRLSAINSKPAAPRTSMGEIKPPSHTSKRAGTPDAKTITRRRVSATAHRSSEDQPHKLSDPPGSHGGITKSASSLRPRNGPVSSALPKYRPKSAMMEGKLPPSTPTRGTRRRFSSSEEEKEDRFPDQTKPVLIPSPSEKVARPISPLPQRAALKANLASKINTPPTTPSKIKPPMSSSPGKTSPTRPTKLVKTANATSATNTAVPRPPSSSSSSSSFTPRTPRTPTFRKVVDARRSGQDKTSRSSPSRLSPQPVMPDSPLTRHMRKNSKSNSSPSTSSSGLANMSHISEGTSEDSEAEDVELLLAPVAALGAPTPAMPRIQASRSRKRMAPQTPTRASNLLPGRANLSYLSPLPPDSEESSSLRPAPRPGSERAARGSILSWEQLAHEASITLGEDEVESMLSEIPAPFRSGAVSPTPSSAPTDIPESPCLSAMNSPGGYGSISQVLLPDVTPSPAVYHNTHRYDLSDDAPTLDGAAVTLLRLQLASAENTAKERLFQLQSMEEEIHNLKEARRREAYELAEQISNMETQICINIGARERAEEERSAYTASLEDELRHTQAYRDQAIEEAVKRTKESARILQDSTLKAQRQTYELSCSARVAMSQWASVRDISECELDLVKADREVLSILLAELDQVQRYLYFPIA